MTDREQDTVHRAALHTLSRLRYYAQTDPHLRGLMGEFDAAVASGLGITPADAPARSRTEALPTEQEKEFERLLEQSSLGAPAARALRERADDDGSFDAALVRRVFDRALADLYADRGWESSVELLTALPAHILRQVRLVLADLAGITQQAQAARPRPTDPPPTP